MRKFEVEHNGKKIVVEAPEGSDVNEILRRANIKGAGEPQAEEGEETYKKPSTAQMVGNTLGAGAAKLGDAFMSDPYDVINKGATLALGGYGLRKGAGALNNLAAAIASRNTPAAGAPTGGPAPVGGGAPSTAGAGTPQQQAASKLATQNLRTQQLHGTLPGGQAQHLGGSKAWTVNPSGIITPDDAMQRTAASAPQQAAPQQGRLAQVADKASKGFETVRNQAGKIIGKVPMGQAGKMLLSGARFVPGLGIIATGATLGMLGYDAYNAYQNSKKKKDEGKAIGGPVGMMKAQIGNYRTGGRIL